MKGDVEVMEWLLRNMPEHADINHSTKVANRMMQYLCITTVMPPFSIERIYSIFVSV